MRVSYILVVALMCVIIAFFYGRTVGVDSCKAKQQKAVDDALKEESELIEQLQSKPTKTIEKTRTVYVEKDPSGCADTAVPDGMLQELRRQD